MTSKLSARQRELLTKMAEGSKLTYSVFGHVIKMRSAFTDYDVYAFEVALLESKGYIAGNGRFQPSTTYDLTDAGRAVVRELVNGEQGDE